MGRDALLSASWCAQSSAWGERKDKSGAYGDDTRLQFTAKYSFDNLDFGW